MKRYGMQSGLRGMKALAGACIIVAAAVTAVAAAEGSEITLAPDSCRVPSPSNLGVMDIVVFTNTAEWGMTSDSMILAILDAADAFAARVESEIPQVTISLNNNYYPYQVQRQGPRQFKLLGQAVRTYPYGGSNYMQSPSIGYNLGGGSSVVVPERMTGLLDVYFPNGQKCTVRLYTDGTTPPVKVVAPRRTAVAAEDATILQWMYTVDGRLAGAGGKASVSVDARGTVRMPAGLTAVRR